VSTTSVSVIDVGVALKDIILDEGVALKDMIREEGVQTRYVIHRENEETRWFIARCTMVVLFFVVGLFLINYVHSLSTPVCAMEPPVPPVCAPCRDTGLPSMWDNYMSCARIFTEDTY
jgi:hypothetical protein